MISRKFVSLFYCRKIVQVSNNFPFPLLLEGFEKNIRTFLIFFFSHWKFPGHISLAVQLLVDSSTFWSHSLLAYVEVGPSGGNSNGPMVEDVVHHLSLKDDFFQDFFGGGGDFNKKQFMDFLCMFFLLIVKLETTKFQQISKGWPWTFR